MMTETERDAIRMLLKTFGIQADGAMVAHLARAPRDQPVRIRLILEDLSDYGSSPPEVPLHLEIEGELRS
jgi:hypothetical protein